MRTGPVRHLRERRLREGRLRPRAGLGQPAGLVRRVRGQQHHVQDGVRQAQHLPARVLGSVARTGRLVQPGRVATQAQRARQGRQLPGAGGHRHWRVRAQRRLHVDHVPQGRRVRRHGHRVHWRGRAGRTHQLVQAAQQRRHRRGATRASVITIINIIN